MSAVAAVVSTTHVDMCISLRYCAADVTNQMPVLALATSQEISLVVIQALHITKRRHEIDKICGTAMQPSTE